jgi:hypothetical protein
LNYRRCFRILGRWHVSDRCSQIVDSQPLGYLLPHLFTDCINDPGLSPKFILLIQWLKVIIPNVPKLAMKEISDKLACRSSSDVIVKVEYNGDLL